MKTPATIAMICCLGAAAAQEIGRLHFRDDDRERGGSTVVIDLTQQPEVPAPPSLNRILEADPSQPDDAAVKVSPQTAPGEDPEPGLSVRVSGFTGSDSDLDPDKISLKAPFPAKPLGPTPDGWKLVRADDSVPIFESEAEVAPGAGIQLKVRPHLLVPADDGVTVFAVDEPGFDAADDYRQGATIGSLLGESIRRLEGDEEQMEAAIDRLEQLLMSLPDPAATAAPAASTDPNPTPEP